MITPPVDPLEQDVDRAAEPFEGLADALIDALDEIAAAVTEALEAHNLPQKVLANRKVAGESTISRWLSGAQQLEHGERLPGVEEMFRITEALRLTGPRADALLALGRRVDDLRDRMRALERSWRRRAREHHRRRAGTTRPAAPRGLQPWHVAAAAAVLVASWGIWRLAPIPGSAGKPDRPGEQAAPLAAAPVRTPRAVQTSGPPSIEAGHELRMVTERMTARLSGRSWTQERTGDIEIWTRAECPPGVPGYWVALRPIGESVAVACGSWQHHRWLGVGPGRHNLDFWKSADGLALKGSTVLRSTVPITEVPR
ncbi:helix-turn-helix domain-containing protein [Nonomuraea sp. NBC_01738]|uniref:helix-turn-helix transcriptional regulator n=1 Tax=Nonomuraea sp. NBC_01738 TaxID=2976003 RepID=UPI002E0DEB47|nr:helix-turn-helix domain-containing protein [Nonomuraea sp. NBC_01738]